MKRSDRKALDAMHMRRMTTALLVASLAGDRAVQRAHLDGRPISDSIGAALMLTTLDVDQPISVRRMAHHALSEGR